MSARRPLEGLKVVEVGLALAGPYAGSLLAELGAQVIKIERPGGGDPLRLMGASVGDVTVWWGIAARAKLCIDLDLKNPDDRDIFLKLIRDADAMVENYRPGVLDRMGLGWSELRKINPRLVMLSISGFGQTGPQSGRPGFGKIAEAMSGIVVLTGESDQVPMHIGFSLADTATGLMGAFGVALGLYQRDVGGAEGTRVDLALFEPLFRMAECQLALAERTGKAPAREGSNDPYGWGVSGPPGTAPGSNHNALKAVRCSDGHWLMLPAVTEQALIRQAESLSTEEALRLLREQGVESARVHDGASLAAEAYFTDRGDVRTASDPVVGRMSLVGEVPKTYRDPVLPLFRATKPDSDRLKIHELAGLNPR